MIETSPFSALLGEKINEEQRVYRSGPYALYGMLYWPVGRNRQIPVVICPPDGEEREWSQRSLVRSARALAAAGHPVLRFDFMGQGESEGAFEDSTIASRANDLRSSVDLLRQATGSMPAVVAVRLGALIATQCATTTPLTHLVLWEPILNGSTYINELLRVNLAGQMVSNTKKTQTRQELLEAIRAGGSVNVNGYNLTSGFVNEALCADPGKWIDAFRGRLLILANRVNASQASSQRTVEVIQCSPFWKQHKTYMSAPPAFLDRTLIWLQEQQ